MILIHELGHYWAALSVGVKVETFSFGFGPRLLGFRRGETDFRISAIPFGGYVRMLGELPGDETAADPRSFQAKTRWQRALVVFAGPLMNILLAIVIVAGVYSFAFPKDVDTTDPVISNITPNSAAAQAGIQVGDKIVQVEGQQHPTWQDVLTREAFSANHDLHLTVDRKGQQLKYTVVPAMDPKQGIGVAGWIGDPDVELDQVGNGSPAQAAGLEPGDLLISISHKPIASFVTVQQMVAQSGGKPIELMILRKGHPLRISVTPIATQDSKAPWRIGVVFKRRGELVKLGLGQAFVESIRFNYRNAGMIFEALSSIVERRVSPKTLEGPIGIAKMSSEAAHEGPLSFLFLMAIVSLNLAIFNLLPIPILDGGTLLLLFVEMLIQRDMSMQVKETVFRLGLVFLVVIVAFVIYNDISKMVSG